MPKATLTDQEVVRLRLEHINFVDPHLTAPEEPDWHSLAAEYGVTRNNLQRALTGQSFKKLPMTYRKLQAWLTLYGDDLEE